MAEKNEDSRPELLRVTSSPHILDQDSVPRIMWDVVIALVPALVVSFFLFGLPVARVLLVCVAGCLLFEWVSLKCRGRGAAPLLDGSAVLTGVLLAMNLPSTSPDWMVLVGAFVAMVFGKHIFGGLGHNPFNPALLARAFLLISWPVEMTTWAVPRSHAAGTDVVTAATPLGALKTGLMSKGVIEESVRNYSMTDMALGVPQGGSLGEMSAVALLLGAAYLLWKKRITWHIPVSFIGTVFVLCGIFWMLDSSRYMDPLFHVFAGGLILGAFYMATDYVTTPSSASGMLIFGVGCGIVTVVIRLWGGYPEGVAFSILLMNSFTPIIDRYTAPSRYGEVVADGA
jgi:electron transport complex protein RnfD